MKELSRRKYSKLVRFLVSVLDSPDNTKETAKIKMQAAERLDAIYARHEARQDAALERAERAAERAVAAQAKSDIPMSTPTPVVEPETAEQAAERFLATMRAKREGVTNGE